MDRASEGRGKSKGLAKLGNLVAETLLERQMLPSLTALAKHMWQKQNVLLRNKHYVGLMQQKYILYWQYTMQNSTILEIFNSFKNDYTPFSYLGLTNKLSERKDLAKFRIGNH